MVYYLVFTVGTIFGACCMALINYRRFKNEKD